MKLYDVKAKQHGESYDAVSELSLEADEILKRFAQDHGWELSELISGEQDLPQDSESEQIILHAELKAPSGGYLFVDFVRYENNRLGIDNKVVVRAFASRGELASSVLRGLKLRPMLGSDRALLLRSELERLAGFMQYT